MYRKAVSFGIPFGIPAGTGGVLSRIGFNSGGCDTTFWSRCCFLLLQAMHDAIIPDRPTKTTTMTTFSR